MNTEQPLVSIIIPTFNRAQLIGETLDSVLAQTYKNWECIIVDDGSTDNTTTVVQQYLDKDPRFQYHHRPEDRPKGANACRNYGFELSKGEFVNWFDDDDLMLSEFISIKIKNIRKDDLDFIVSKSEDFEEGDIHNSLGIYPGFYNDKAYELSHDNYARKNFFWLNPDLMLRRESVKNLKFNERLKSGQEYNFFLQYTALNVNGRYINEVLTKRRMHRNSTQGRFKENSLLAFKETNELDFENWKNLKKLRNESTVTTIQYFFYKSLQNALRTEINYPLGSSIQLCFELIKKGKIQTACLFILYQLLKNYLNRGHFIRKKLIKLLEQNTNNL